MSRIIALGLAVVALTAAIWARALAENFPDRPIKLHVSVPADYHRNIQSFEGG